MSRSVISVQPYLNYARQAWRCLPNIYELSEWTGVTMNQYPSRLRVDHASETMCQADTIHVDSFSSVCLWSASIIMFPIKSKQYFIQVNQYPSLITADTGMRQELLYETWGNLKELISIIFSISNLIYSIIFLISWSSIDNFGSRLIN